MAQECPGHVYPVTSIRQTLANMQEPPAAQQHKRARDREQKVDAVKRLDFCLDCLSIQLTQYQNTRTVHMRLPLLRHLAVTRKHFSAHQLPRGGRSEQSWNWRMTHKQTSRIQRQGEMLDGDADLNRGNCYGQGSEGTGKGTKMHLFPTLSVTFSHFKMQIPQ